MSEIKVGDRVRTRYVSSFDTMHRPKEVIAEGIVEEIIDNCIKVLFPAGAQWWHRWQCRLLVKMAKCEYCTPKVKCPICIEKGKVRA